MGSSTKRHNGSSIVQCLMPPALALAAVIGVTGELLVQGLRSSWEPPSQELCFSCKAQQQRSGAIVLVQLWVQDEGEVGCCSLWSVQSRT